MIKRYLKNSAILLLLQRMIVAPRRIGTILPSSKKLANYMALEALKTLKSPNDFIVEIGAGTGCITQALLVQGLAPERLICIELDPNLYSYLVQKFPMLTITQGDASSLKELINAEKQGKISAVVSGIPMRNFSPLAQDLIVQACLAVLSPTGSIIQFTYGFISPIAVPGFTATRLTRIYANIPPASVWVYTSPQPAARIKSPTPQGISQVSA